MGITSGKKSNHQPEEEERGRSYLGDLPEIIEDCIELFGEDDPLTQQYRQELIDLTKLKQRRENNPNHYEEEEEWHAGMVPNLRPKSEKGLEEEDSEDEDEEDGPAEEADGPALNPEAPKAEPDLSPMSKAGGDGK